MPKEKMLWSEDKLRSVRANKLREFRIEFQHRLDGDKYMLGGMFNKTDMFVFGLFDTEDNARIFLIGIHQIIEGKKEG